MELFSLQNIITGDGINISLGGMSIVFGGLLIISIYIALLPKLLNLISRKKVKKVEETETLEAKYTKKREIDENKDIASVIGLILQMEQERLVQSSNQVITFSLDRLQQSNWRRAGAMRIIPERRRDA